MLALRKTRCTKPSRKSLDRLEAALDRLLPAAVSTDPDWEGQARELVQAEMEYIYSPEFRDPEAADEILSAEQIADEPDASAWTGRGLPAHLVRLCEANLLKPAEERNLFRRMNFAKYQADLLRRQIDPRRPRWQLLSLVQRLLAIAVADRNRIVRANLRLVISIAKGFVDAKQTFDDLLSEGVSPLLRAVEKFDYDRGFRFSTYATLAVRRTLSRQVTNARRDRSRYMQGEPLLLEQIPDEPAANPLDERQYQQRTKALTRMLGRLDSRERAIIRRRFGLESEGEVLTLQALAAELGICKERVRQIEQRALAKLRAMADAGADALESI